MILKVFTTALFQRDGLPKLPFQAIIGACAGESYIRLHVAAEGADALKSLRQQGLHVEIKHLESGAIAPTEGEKAV